MTGSEKAGLGLERMSALEEKSDKNAKRTAKNAFLRCFLTEYPPRFFSFFLNTLIKLPLYGLFLHYITHKQFCQ